MFSLYRNKQHSTSGFSLVEVLITSAIIGIITAIVVVKYGAFNSSVLLRNQAYEVALAVRQAQVFSISVRSDTNEFRHPYGIHVDLSGGSAQKITLFLDDDPEGQSGHDEFNAGEEVEELFLDSRFEIFELCIGNADPLACTVTDLTIMFERPDFDAKISSTGMSGGALQQNGHIGIRGTKDTTYARTVIINATGQISVQ